MPRRLGTSEYGQLRTQLGASPSTFNKYFLRSGNNILVRDQYDPKFPNKNIRNVGLEAGRPDAYASLGGEFSQEVADNLPRYQQFGNQVMDLLKQYQTINREPFKQGQLSTQQEQAKRLSSTDPNLIGASPEQQAASRSSAVGALEPTVQGAQEAERTFTSQLGTFKDILGQARLIYQDLETSSSKARDNARELIQNTITDAGGDAFAGLDQKELERLEKIAGYPKGYITQIARVLDVRERQSLRSKAPETVETSQGIFQWNPQTGKWEASGLRPYVAPRSGSGGTTTTGKGYKIKKNYDRSTGQYTGFTFLDNRGDPIPAFEYAQAVGKRLDQVLSGSGDPGDQALVEKIRTARAKGISEDQIMDALRQDARHLFEG